MKTIIKSSWKLLLLCLFTAILGHSYFIFLRINEGIVMASMFDQTSQMIPFKAYLYQQFTHGNFFYDYYGNISGDFFTRLSYYFSTSVFFYFSVLMTSILNSFGIIKEVNFSYWAEIVMYLSIFRATLTIFITYKYLRYLKISQNFAYLSSSIYALSIIYFRHVASWEFFADAMVWLPLIFWGIEKIIHHEDGKIFVLGIALSLFNNGYFAYVNLILAIYYVLLRWCFKFSKNELSIKKQIIKFLSYGLIALGIALPGFIAFVLGFKNTIRPNIIQFNLNFEIINLNQLSKILVTSDIFVVPVIFMLLCFCFKLYHSPKIRFAFVGSIILILLSFNPLIGSIFNGFSDPQFRWNYGTNLFIALAIGFGLDQLIFDTTDKDSSKKSLLISVFVNEIIYLYILIYKKSYTEAFIPLVIAFFITNILLMLLVTYTKRIKTTNFLLIALLFMQLISTIPALNQLVDHHKLHTTDYFNQLDQQDSDINQALNYLKKNNGNFYRIDMYSQGLHYPMNYLMSQNLNTSYLYSSFQNKYQQNFEDKFLLEPYHYRNSGEVLGPNGRANLLSLLNINYIVKSKNQSDLVIPSSFDEETNFNNVQIFKNKYPMAYIHPVKKIYNQDDLSNKLYKDHLVRDGAILSEITGHEKEIAQPNYLKKLDFSLILENANYKDNQLSAIENTQPMIIRFKINSELPQNAEINFAYSLKPTTSGYGVYSINNIVKRVVSEDLLYGGKWYNHQIDICPDKNNEIVFSIEPNLNYDFRIYDLVYDAKDNLATISQSNQNLDYTYHISKNGIDIQFNNTDDYPYLTLPIFYNKGLHATVNGTEVPVINTNYGLTGLFIEKGQNKIHIQYHQPYLLITCTISILSLGLLSYLTKRQNNT